MDILGKKQIIKISALLGIVTIVFGVTYAFINVQLTGSKKQVITAGTLDLILEEDENNLTITDALPMYDDVGMIQEPFTFRLINNVEMPTNYILKLVDITTGDKLPTNVVKYGLTKNGVGEPALLSTLPESGQIDAGVIGDKETIEYTLRLWIDSSVTDNSQISGKSLSYRVDLEVNQTSEQDSLLGYKDKSGANVPVLTSGMIPVVYDEASKEWIKADTTEEWYDYEEQWWANAVTVTESTRASYMALEAGEPIDMDDINTMWVWIPRYSYTIKQPYGANNITCSDLGEITIDSPEECRSIDYPTQLRQDALAICKSWFPDVSTEQDCLDNNGGYYATFEDFIDDEIYYGDIEDTRVISETYPDRLVSNQRYPGMIDIKFITINEIDSGTGKYENTVENWVTPEGFKFGEENIPGFWMAKFETSTLETCAATDGSVNTACDLLTLTPQVKPNVTSWRGARVSTFFESSRLMQSSDDTLTYNANTYGFDEEGTGTMDVHMLKNTEWGIVAYLSQSRYGKYGNSSYNFANKEVYQNKSETYITGNSNGTPSQEEYADSQFTYDIPNTGYGASTTGTIYGVYDMSGGADEYVMGNYKNYSGSTISYNSGFCGMLNYDGIEMVKDCRQFPASKYYDLYESNNSASSYKVGDATYETREWYLDSNSFVDTNIPWFTRGGLYLHDTYAGIYTSYYYEHGEASYNNSARLSIKP